jgi:hypothetical protein
MGVHHCHRPSCTKTYMVSGDTTLQDKRSPLEASRDLFARRIMDAGQAGSKRKQPPTMPRVTVKRQKKVTQSDPLARVFETRGLKLLNRNPTSQSTETSNQRFKAHFGVPPEICADVWLRLNPSTLPHKATIEHLLWSFFLLRQYPKEAIGATIAGVHEQTWRNWSWYFVDRVSQLEVDVVRSRTEHFALFLTASFAHSFFRLTSRGAGLVMTGATA